MNQTLPYAVIDLGSNTFHLLIACLVDGEIIEQYRERVFVGLGDGGIDRLKEETIALGISTLKNFATILNGQNCKNISIIGTAALRTASNAQYFIEQAEQALGQKIEIIDGKREAELIFKGAALITDLNQGQSVIMDIGGGSTEFILVEHGQMLWSNSYKLGVGVLHSLFHKTEPIAAKDNEACRKHIRFAIRDMVEVLKGRKIDNLVGASGSFEVLETMNGFEIGVNSNKEISIDATRKIATNLIAAGFEDRSNLKGLPQQRVKLIVVAMILIDEVLNILQPQKLIVTPYALKEGVLSEMAAN